MQSILQIEVVEIWKSREAGRQGRSDDLQKFHGSRVLGRRYSMLRVRVISIGTELNSI